MIDKIKQAIELHKKVLADYENNSLQVVAQTARCIIDAIEQGGRVFICGNGGSAADAQHIAAEIVGRFLEQRRALPAIALTVDTSIITAVANDYDYDYIFARQLEALARPGDVLWALSTSGTSPNIMRAVEAARQQGLKIISFTGKENSPLQQQSDICLCTPAPASYPAQEIHQLAYHSICMLVEEAFCS